MLKLEDSCNKEIFLVYDDEKNDSSIPVQICIISDFTDLIIHLKELVLSIDSETRILHGMLTKALNIPKNLRGKTPFIIINDANDRTHGLILETDARSDKDLTSKISSILTRKKNDPIKIKDIYVFYGYEISITLTVDEEEIDEENISTCQKIIVDTKSIELLTNGENFDEQKTSHS